jgi:hypothetical protein
MTYQAKITTYDYAIIEGEPAIIIRNINVFDDKGNYIRQAQLNKILPNLQNMTVTFDQHRPIRSKAEADTVAMRTLMETATGEYLPDLDKQIVLDWFIRAYPEQYRFLEGKYSDLFLDSHKKGILFSNRSDFFYAVEGIEL